MAESEGRWTRSRDGPLYAALILGWLLLVTVSFAVVIHEGWERIEADFQAHAEREVIALQERLRGNEAVLDGFAAFLGSVDEPTDAQLRHFAERVLRTQPHIYMLEVVRRVEADDRPAFERALALRVGGGWAHQPVRLCGGEKLGAGGTQGALLSDRLHLAG